MRQGAQGWCTGMTLRVGMGKEVGGRFRMGNTCTPMADSCRCMAKTTTKLLSTPLYILASFVKDKVSICVWIYLWAFYFVPLIYMSVFVPAPYCHDDCGFVVEPEVRQVDSSSSILLSQDCFGYLRSFVFTYKL